MGDQQKPNRCRNRGSISFPAKVNPFDDTHSPTTWRAPKRRFGRCDQRTSLLATSWGRDKVVETKKQTLFVNEKTQLTGKSTIYLYILYIYYILYILYIYYIYIYYIYDDSPISMPFEGGFHIVVFDCHRVSRTSRKLKSPMGLWIVLSICLVIQNHHFTHPDFGVYDILWHIANTTEHHLTILKTQIYHAWIVVWFLVFSRQMSSW